MPRAHPEQDLHRQVADFLDLALGIHSWWSTMPLGGGGRVRGAMLKRVGVKAGLPDILVVHGGRAIWIELKSPKGRESDDQIACTLDLRCAKCPTYVCRSLDEVITALTESGVPLKARAA